MPQFFTARRTAMLATAGLTAAALAGTACSTGSTPATDPPAQQDAVATSPRTALVTSGGIFEVAAPLEWAELSGVAHVDRTGQYLIVDDKTPDENVGEAVLTPPGSDWPDPAELAPDTDLPDRKIQKLEAITTTPAGDWVVATTAYHKFKPGTLDKSTYNVTFAFRPENPENITILGRADEKPKTSLALRYGLLKALGDPAYIRVEGLAATDTHLLFGVRQMGDDNESGKYGVTIVEVPYSTVSGDMVVDPDQAKVVYEMDDATKQQAPIQGFGVSDLWRNPDTGELMMLTSVEDPLSQPVLAGFLWSISPEQFASGEATIMQQQGGDVLQFENKTEGITRMPSGEFLIVSDNDDYVDIGPGKGKSPYYVVSVP